MTKKEKEMITKEWRVANNKLGFLSGWSLGDIREGKHPDYETDIEYMQDRGYYEGIQDLCQRLLG